MEIDFWAARWKEGRIGFHEGRANKFLERHVAELGSSKRVLVPLAGKSEDMAYLASKGHEVVGVEVVEDAVRAFFAEHGLTPEVSENGPARIYHAERVTIVAADFFACTPALLGPITGFYDRAALVALPANIRPRYVAHLRSLLAPAAPGVVITFDYPQDRLDGPPFAISDEELRKHYAGAKVEELESGPATGPRFAESGVDAVERCYAVTS